MSIALSESGIQSITLPLLVSSRLGKRLEVTEEILNGDGTLREGEVADAFDPKQVLELEGKGDLPAAMALATDAALDHDGVTGGVIICVRVRRSQQSKQHNRWSATINHYPGAVAA